jgi:hypothetical protein
MRLPCKLPAGAGVTISRVRGLFIFIFVIKEYFVTGHNLTDEEYLYAVRAINT